MDMKPGKKIGVSTEKYDIDKKFCNCFGCSPNNPDGMQLKVEAADGHAAADYVPPKKTEGLTGLMHGGFSMMLMDEIMYYSVESLGCDSVALHTETDFKGRAYIGHKLRAEGNVERREGRKFYTVGRLWDTETGEDVVTATGLYYEVDLNQFLPDEA